MAVLPAVSAMHFSSIVRERSGSRCRSPIILRRTLFVIKVSVSSSTALTNSSISPSTSACGRFQFSVLNV